MKVLTSCFLGCLALQRTVAVSVVSPIGPIGDKRVRDGEDLKLLLNHLSQCRDDPKNCGDVADNTEQISDQIEDNVNDDVNKTQEELNNMTFDVIECKQHLGDISSYTSSFDDMVGAHKTCRTQQAALDSAYLQCTELQGTQKTLEEAQCRNNILDKPVSDFVDICKPSSQEPLGQWLEAMRETFANKYQNWQTQFVECTKVTWTLGNTTERCTLMQGNSTAQAQACDEELSSIESFSCAWASASESRCSSYETCWESAVQKYDEKVKQVPAAIAQWKESWVAAQRTKCMASAISSSGAVDSAKMQQCDNKSSFDASHIQIHIPERPVKETCAEPQIYPGSSMYQNMVYGELPAGVEVRKPTQCDPTPDKTAKCIAQAEKLNDLSSMPAMVAGGWGMSRLDIDTFKFTGGHFLGWGHGPSRLGALYTKLSGNGQVTLSLENEHKATHAQNWVRVLLNGVEKARLNAGEKKTLRLDYEDGDLLRIEEQYGAIFLKSVSCSTNRICPAGYDSISNNLDGQGKTWDRDHTLDQCAENCNAREGCTGFEYSNKGDCGTYTGPAATLTRADEGRGEKTHWKSCIKLV